MSTSMEGYLLNTAWLAVLAYWKPFSMGPLCFCYHDNIWPLPMFSFVKSEAHFTQWTNQYNKYYLPCMMVVLSEFC